MSDRRVVDYMVCEFSNAETLSDGVMMKIEKGWQPFGQLVKHEGGFVQAMVRYECPHDSGLRLTRAD